MLMLIVKFSYDSHKHPFESTKVLGMSGSAPWKTTIATNPTNQSEDHPSDIVTYQIYSNHVFFWMGSSTFGDLLSPATPQNIAPT